MTEIDVTSQLFMQAAMLMLTGMGFVFVFLSLLIAVIKFLITPLASRFPDDVSPASSNREPANHMIAAITAAVKQYRQQHPPGSN